MPQYKIHYNWSSKVDRIFITNRFARVFFIDYAINSFDTEAELVADILTTYKENRNKYFKPYYG